jgi:hypothetical protein
MHNKVFTTFFQFYDKSGSGTSWIFTIKNKIRYNYVGQSMIRKNICYTLTAVFILSDFSGCTIFGFLEGLKKDRANSVIEPLSLNKIEKIRPDTPVRIELRENKVITGSFQGLENADPAEYSRRYDTFRNGQEYNQLFPALNSTITMIKRSGFRTFLDDSKYLFLGFDYNAISVQSLPYGNAGVENLDSLVALIDQQGNRMNAQTIKEYVDEGIVPLRSELLIQSSRGLQRISGEKVGMIRLPRPITGRITYTLIGFSIDVVMILFISNLDLHLIDLGP